MRKSEIKVGGHYLAKVSGVITTVRVDAVREVETITRFRGRSIESIYDVTNLATGRKIAFRSAAKFRSEVPARGSEEYKSLKPSTANKFRSEVPARGSEEYKSLKPSTANKAKQCLDPISSPTQNAEASTRAPTSTTCPRCGQAVTVTDGRYDYHKHATKKTTCGMSGERVVYVRPDGKVDVTVQPREGEQSADPMPSVPTAASPSASPKSPSATLDGFVAGDATEASGTGSLLSKLRSSPTDAAPPHVVVTARAGTGKTTTLVEGLKQMKGLATSIVPSPQQRAVWDQLMLSKDARTVCFVAFNRSIAQELKDRVPPGCEASTMHSMGLKAVTRAFGRLDVSEYVVPDIIADILGTDVRQLRKENPMLLKATADLVSLCKMNLTQPEHPVNGGRGGTSWDEELSTLAAHYDVDLDKSRRQVFDLVPQVLDRCRDPKRQGQIDYDDMVWLPTALNLPVFRHDLLLVDEAQDLNRCQQALAKKAGKRLILVGDERQAIYGFAGADSESIPRMMRELNGGEMPPAQALNERGCIILPLTITRRCGKRIVEEARQYVPDFGAHESNPEGEVKEAKYPIYKDSQGVRRERPWEQTYGPAVKEGDMVLCRTNAPLVSQCFRFLKRGIKANIQGRDVGQGLVALVRKSKAEKVEDLLRWLEDWHDAEKAKENAKKNPSEAKLTAVADRYQCLLCFAEGLATVDEVVAKIESVFTDDKQKPGVKFSSVHKAKGLEAKNVFILHPPEGGPRTERMKPWELQQEDNIRYVAVTRAIDVLTYVG